MGGVFEHAEAAEAERVKWLHWVPQFEGAIHNELQSVYHSVKMREAAMTFASADIKSVVVCPCSDLFQDVSDEQVLQWRAARSASLSVKRARKRSQLRNPQLDFNSVTDLMDFRRRHRLSSTQVFMLKAPVFSLSACL